MLMSLVYVPSAQNINIHGPHIFQGGLFLSHLPHDTCRTLQLKGTVTRFIDCAEICFASPPWGCQAWRTQQEEVTISALKALAGEPEYNRHVKNSGAKGDLLAEPGCLQSAEYSF